MDAKKAKILSILHEIRSMLISHTIKNKTTFKCNYGCNPLTLSDSYKIVEFTNKMTNYYGCDVFGCTLIHCNFIPSDTSGVKIADPKSMKIDYLGVRLMREDNSDVLSLPSIIHTFIHELAHTITLPESHQYGTLSKLDKKIQPTVTASRDGSKIKKKTMIPYHHNESFYANFATLLRLADKLNIYKVPSTFRNLSPISLRRFDTIINPKDNMSTGTSPLFSI
jgi:hypothetical protein